MPTDAITLLLAEDDQMLQELYLENFTDAGFNVLQAFNGSEVLPILEEHPEVNLVLLDIMLPRMSGYDVLNQIRSSGRRQLPVVIVSALGDIDDQARGLQLGATDYITKGAMLPSAVIEKIKSYVLPVPGSTPQ